MGPIWLQCGSRSRIFGQCRSGSSSESGSRVLITINPIFLLQKLLFSSLGLQEGSSRYRRSLDPTKDNIKSHFQTKNFYIFSSFCCALLDPDPGDKNQCGSMRIRMFHCSPFLLMKTDPLVTVRSEVRCSKQYFEKINDYWYRYKKLPVPVPRHFSKHNILLKRALIYCTLQAIFVCVPGFPKSRTA